MNILIISNGHGEDHIAYNIIEQLQHQSPNTKLHVLPLVGEGLIFKKHKLTPLLKNKIMPSGGFIRDFKTLFKDFRAGLIAQTFHQMQQIKKNAQHADVIICVGDIFCLWMGTRKKKTNNVYFLPTAKSDLFMAHSPKEIKLMQRHTKITFTRDKITADNLIKHNINAQYLGNPMMDNMTWSGNTLGLSETAPILGLLPGSREEAYHNLHHMLKVVIKLHEADSKIQFVLARSQTMELLRIGEIARKTGWYLEQETASIPTHLAHPIWNAKVIITPEFTDIIGVANTFLGLAGTANEQVAYLGKEVFAFEGFGPQSTEKRFSEQKKLLGDKLHFLKLREPEKIATTLKEALYKNHRQFYYPETNSASEKIVNTLLTDIQNTAKQTTTTD